MPDSASQRPVASQDNERYLVHSRLEITAILRSLIEHSALVTVYFGDRSEFIVTALLTINPEFEELIFDYGADDVLNARLLESSRLTLVTQLDHIRVQFVASRAEATTFQEMPAFRIRLPDALTRLQRRENYRVKVPMSQRVTCTLHLDPADSRRSVAIRICDVSGGGIALVDFPPSLELVPGTVYPDCHIDLREIGRVTTDIEIVHVMEKASRNAVKTRLCGCRFRNMPNAMLTLIQRYINKIERDQKALS
jgi:c-di-GMP-binding flagellar brake protein YcgR